MKKLVLLFNLLLVSQILSAQDETKKFKFPINEFRASVNMTAVKDKYTENREGFGLGVYRSGSSGSLFNLVTGLEFNTTKQFKIQFDEMLYQSLYNTEYTISTFAIPLGLRVNTGGRVRFFAEAGLFAEFLSASRRKGTFFKVTNPFAGEYYSKEVDENAYLDKLNYGYSGGFGVSVPIGKIELLVKADGKIGIVDLHPYRDYNYKVDQHHLYNRCFRLWVGVKL